METTLKPRLFDSIAQFASEDGDGAALMIRRRRDTESISHRTVYERICAVRAAYRNWQPERIGLLMDNSAEYLYVSEGILLTGKTAGLLDVQSNLQDLIRMIGFSDLDAVLYDEQNADLALEIGKALPGLLCRRAEVPDFAPDMQDGADEWTEGDLLFFTSGTSKSSKAVVVPAWAMEGGNRGGRKLRAYDSGCTVLIPAPLFHAYSYSALFAYYALNCPVAIGSMRSVLRDAEIFSPRHMVLVPSAVEFLLKKDAFGDNMRYLLVSGSYLPPELAAEVGKKGVIVQNQYGSSELPYGNAISPATGEIQKLQLSDGIDLRLTDDGEVVLNTINRFAGYYKNPEDTAEMLRNGEYYTGDMGFLDEEGCLHLLGRRKNMILMENGDKVFYTDIDEALKGLPGVDDAAVIYADKLLIAVIAPEHDGLEDVIRSGVESYNAGQPVGRMIRRIWLYGNKLPYTNSGKLARSVLEREYPGITSFL